MSRIFQVVAAFMAACTLILLSVQAVSAQEKPVEEGVNTLVVAFREAKGEVQATSGKSSTALSGELKFAIRARGVTPSLELLTFNVRGKGVRTERGESGNLSIQLRPGSSKTTYDPRSGTVEAQFIAEVHYPLIDRVLGFKEQRRGEKELDIFESYTQAFRGRAQFQLEQPFEPPKEKYRRIKGSPLEIELKINRDEAVFAEVSALLAKLEVEYFVFDTLYIVSDIDIQPVFIRYTPPSGCTIGTATTATTGGSFPTLRDYSIEMWSRCCFRLRFLPEVFVADDDYRVLSAVEESNLRAEYDDPDAIEVFFVEVADPVGLHGGGVTFSIGTANTQIITYDTNLPINLYNLAHELGHAFGLFHPPGNATVGSLLEPSGFCADNPALMSDLNCDNAGNPLFYTSWPFRLCFRNTNM